MNGVLSESQSHKVGHAQLHSTIKWKWYICHQAQPGPEGTSKSHEELAQRPVVPSPANPLSLFQPAPVASWGVPCNQLTEEEKIRAWFIDCSASYAAPPLGGQLQCMENNEEKPS